MKIPKDWTFKDNSVAVNFNDHVRQQLPWYDLATKAISHIIQHYLPVNGLVYDIGASTGNIENSITNLIISRNAKIIAVEESLEMVANYKGNAKIINENAMDIEYEKFDVAVLMLVVMFLNVNERKSFLSNLCKSLNKGGVIIILDKINIEQTYLSTLFHRLTIKCKIDNKASSDEILEKEMSLGGIQRPVSIELIKNLANESFLRYYEFFRYGEFVGWILEREE